MLWSFPSKLSDIIIFVMEMVGCYIQHWCKAEVGGVVASGGIPGSSAGQVIIVCLHVILYHAIALY